MALSPTQKKMLMYGVPAIAVLGLVVWLRSRSASPATTATATGTTSPSDTAVGLGQLASFENAVQGQIAQIGAMLSGPAAPSGSTAVAPAPNPTPAPVVPSGPLTNPSSVQASVGGSTYNLINNPQTGSVLAAAGKTVYAIESGVAVPVVVNDQWTAAGKALPTGSHLYVAS